MAGVVEKKLVDLGIVLPIPAAPVANYVGFVRTGSLLIVSGQLCLDGDGKLVAKGNFDEEDLQAFSDSYSKPLDHEGMRENELISQMQDQMEATLAQLMRYLSEQQ